MKRNLKIFLLIAVCAITVFCMLYVREENKKQQIRSLKKEEKEKEADPQMEVIYQQLEERIKSIVGTKVAIQHKNKNKGKIEIEYYSQAELERLIDLFESIKES